MKENCVVGSRLPEPHSRPHAEPGPAWPGTGGPEAGAGQGGGGAVWWQPPRPPSTPGSRAWRLPLRPLFLARVRLCRVDPKNKTTSYFYQQKGVHLGATPCPSMPVCLSPPRGLAARGPPPAGREGSPHRNHVCPPSELRLISGHSCLLWRPVRQPELTAPPPHPPGPGLRDLCLLICLSGFLRFTDSRVGGLARVPSSQSCGLQTGWLWGVAPNLRFPIC